MKKSDSNAAKHIVILGGGTAGWMTANLMAACWRERGFTITLIESSDIGTVGVGEGSTPQLKQFFDFLNIQESEWMPRCHATYKNGITFADWSTRPGFTEYFHPFGSEVDFKSEEAFFYNCEMRRRGVNIDAHPNRFFLASALADKKLAPLPNDNFPFKVEYGYHFDAGLLGQFLRSVALKAGVRHIDDRVVSVSKSADGDIKALKTESMQEIDGDFFVDCSGFAAVLIQQELDVPFVSFAQNLFNDRAVAIPSAQGEAINSQTISTAMKHGWAWEIPLTNRVGNGYVYSSQHCTQDAAEIELRTKLNLLDSDVEARHLKMKVGRVEKHWYKNCLAVGLSQGFIEPLEATALHLVQETVQGFIDAYELGNFSNLNEDKFNTRINAKFEGIRDYIVTHYALNTRNDTPYWQANREHTHFSDSLKQVMQCWMHGEDLKAELEQQGIDKYYTAMSWHSIFSGYGTYLPADKLRQGTAKAYQHNLQEIDDFIIRCGLNFRPHSEVLKQQ